MCAMYAYNGGNPYGYNPMMMNMMQYGHGAQPQKTDLMSSKDPMVLIGGSLVVFMLLKALFGDKQNLLSKLGLGGNNNQQADTSQQQQQAAYDPSAAAMNQLLQQLLAEEAANSGGDNEGAGTVVNDEIEKLKTENEELREQLEGTEDEDALSVYDRHGALTGLHAPLGAAKLYHHFNKGKLVAEATEEAGEAAAKSLTKTVAGKKGISPISHAGKISTQAGKISSNTTKAISAAEKQLKTLGPAAQKAAKANITAAKTAQANADKAAKAAVALKKDVSKASKELRAATKAGNKGQITSARAALNKANKAMKSQLTLAEKQANAAARKISAIDGVLKKAKITSPAKKFGAIGDGLKASTATSKKAGTAAFDAASTATKELAAGKHLAKEVTEEVAETGIKAGAKRIAKAGGKSLLKKIPGIGLLAGIGFAIERGMNGDFVGAGMEVLSGAASIVPGPGTAISAGIDAVIIGKDMYYNT